MSSLFSWLLFCFLLPLQLVMGAWTEDYAEAVETAQASQTPMLIAFLGSEWCPWSDKLRGEVLETAHFQSQVKDYLILVRVDFPYVGLRKNSEELKAKYEIKQLPTLIIASPTGEEITRFGYLPLEGAEFASHVTTLLNTYEKLVQQISQTNLSQEPVTELRTLYQEITPFTLPIYKEALLHAGLQKDSSSFFLLEKYEQLLKKEPKLAEKMREQIEARDPEDREGALFKLAALDFTTLSAETHSIKKVVRPLKKYLKKFSSHENAWRAHLLIAEYLFLKRGNKNEAQQHLEASLIKAPSKVKPQLEEFLKGLQGFAQ